MQTEKHTFFGANLHSRSLLVSPCRVTVDILDFEASPAPLLLLLVPSPLHSWCFTVVAPSANLSLLFVIICANYHRCAWVASRHWHGHRGDRALSEANALIHHSNIEPSAERSHCLQQANDQEQQMEEGMWREDSAELIYSLRFVARMCFWTWLCLDHLWCFCCLMTVIGDNGLLCWSADLVHLCFGEVWGNCLSAGQSKVCTSVNLFLSLFWAFALTLSCSELLSLVLRWRT